MFALHFVIIIFLYVFGIEHGQFHFVIIIFLHDFSIDHGQFHLAIIVFLHVFGIEHGQFHFVIIVFLHIFGIEYGQFHLVHPDLLKVLMELLMEDHEAALLGVHDFGDNRPSLMESLSYGGGGDIVIVDATTRKDLSATTTKYDTI